MARLWARTATFESISVGDTLPILVKWETRDTINGFTALLSPGDLPGDLPSDTPEGPEARPGVDPVEPDAAAGPFAPAQALLAYVTELLEKAFPVPNLMAQGSRLELELLSPVRPEDTISLTGRVVGKSEDAAASGLSRRLVECEVLIDNQEGQAIARAQAVVAW